METRGKKRQQVLNTALNSVLLTESQRGQKTTIETEGNTSFITVSDKTENKSVFSVTMEAR